MKRYDNKLLLHNIKVNGLKSLSYCYCLGDSRYVEYSLALDYLYQNSKGGDHYVLDMVCGHSIRPTFLVQNVVSTGVILDALKWQIQKSTESSDKNGKIFAVRGSTANLPFKDEAFAFISCISVIEHLPGNLDVVSSKEIGRVLKHKGDAVITVPGVGEENAIKESTGLYTEIPSLYIKLFGPLLPKIFQKMGVDRRDSFYERRYTIKEAYVRRISMIEKELSPRVIVLEQDFLMRVIDFLHRKTVPLATFTPFEFIAEKVLKTKKWMLDSEGRSGMICIVLRKQKFEGCE